MEFIKKTFKKDTILLIYKCGSYAFGTSNELSDEDYIVVLKDFNGLKICVIAKAYGHKY